MFEKVNLEKALKVEREAKRESRDNKIIDQFRGLFKADWERDVRILETIKKGAVSSELPSADNLPEERIFDINSIRNLCIKYRLRFLSTKQFKGGIPSEAIAEAKKAEKLTGQNVDAFMIAAPSRLFKLEDANKDPLLFMPLEDGRFYLVHQWGNDMAWYRKLLFWPVSSPLAFIATIMALSLAITIALPSSLLSSGNEFFNFMRLVAFGWNVVFLLGVSSYLWFASHSKFSIHAWNSKTFN